MTSLAYSISETGKLLGGEGEPLSRATIHRMIQRNQLEAFKLGSRTMITRQSIEDAVASAPRVAAA